MPLDDKVEKMNGGVYGVLKVLLGKAGNNIAGAVNHRRIETYWGKRSMKVWKLVYLW
ncbi:hypothetical protein [Dialister invisus]|uniref:hypothetical protein n=1 Tax=Dialister invisus TaxID=218538 RepID=UPI0028EDC199|nr:hypothetical protein [Dialister invisus]